MTNSTTNAIAVSIRNTIKSILSGKENSSNKVTNISASSTDVEYPSAKLLYDKLALKSDTNHEHNYLTSSDISGKENTSNKLTSTTGWSNTLTDTKYPSEKLVKEYIDEQIGQAITYINS